MYEITSIKTNWIIVSKFSLNGNKSLFDISLKPSVWSQEEFERKLNKTCDMYDTYINKLYACQRLKECMIIAKILLMICSDPCFNVI